MDEENPLLFFPLNNCKPNKSGRPSNEKILKFSPQPQSHVSQMLKKMKEGNNKASLSPVKAVSLNFITLEEDSLEDYSNYPSNQNYDDVKDVVIVKPKLVNSPKGGKNKTYPCPFANCSYVSKFSSNLIKHQRTHTSEKPFMCDLCSFRSNFVNSLKVHKRIHTDQRPFACTYCCYRCNSSSNLKKHCKHRHFNIEK